jgi:hypothetical protein
MPRALVVAVAIGGTPVVTNAGALQDTFGMPGV